MRNLFNNYEIQIQVQNLAIDIGEKLPPTKANGPLAVVSVLKSSFVFLADLIRELPHNLTIDFVSAKSYLGQEQMGLHLNVSDSVLESIRDRNVLIVEDIYDSGKTLNAVIHRLKSKAKTVSVCALLRREGTPDLDINGSQFYGFTIPKNMFVFGYGLDYDGLYRNLPSLCVA